MKTPDAKACAKCGASLPVSASTGRPRIYCSIACRRLAEMAIRSLSRRMEHLEETMSAARIAPPDGGPWSEPPDECRARLERVAAEIDLTERRLRALFSEEDQ